MLAITWMEGFIYVLCEEFQSQHQPSSHPFPVNFGS
jgi:hypothetical protein